MRHFSGIRPTNEQATLHRSTTDSQSNRPSKNWEAVLFCLVVVLIFFSSSCKKNTRRESAAKIVKEWTGKEVKFPKNIPCYVSGQETLTEFCEEGFQKEYKILLYVDSTGCSNCRLQLFEWKQLMEEADSLFNGKVGFILFFSTQNSKRNVFSVCT